MNQMREPVHETCEQVDEVWRRLRDHYGLPQLRPSGDPLSSLVQTILSQNTTDKSSAMAYDQLRERFSSWDAVAAAPIDDVAGAIRSAGLAEQKAATIQLALKHFTHSDLLELREQTVHDARATLTSVRGIGEKTASCVLLFALGMPAQPVDTHIERVSKRIGIAAEERTPKGIQHVLESCLAADGQTMFAFHIDLIRFGREICVARGPKCELCFLNDICAYVATTNSRSAD